jgi:hypothetical protein
METSDINDSNIDFSSVSFINDGVAEYLFTIMYKSYTHAFKRATYIKEYQS